MLTYQVHFRQKLSVSAFILVFFIPLLVVSSPGEKEASEGNLQFKRYPDVRANRVSDEKVKTFRKEIDKKLEESDLAVDSVGVLLKDMYTSQVLYTKNAEKAFNPASNVKLFTSAAALHRFGPDYTFKTKLLTEDPRDKVLESSLYIRGTGEAFLLFEDFINWAAQLKARGIEKIKGDIVIDDSVFQGSHLPPGYDQKKEDDAYRSSIGAVSVNFNAVTAIVRPSKKEGEPPNVRLFPPNAHVEVINEAKTVAGHIRSVSGDLKTTENGTKIHINGELGMEASPVRSRKRVDNPPLFAGSVLAKAIQMVGIDFQGRIRTGKTPDDLEVLVNHESQPLSYILLAMNKWSNNFMAEQLLRTLGIEEGKPSTWVRSKQAVLNFLDELGLKTESLEYFNGSGLYDGNKASPRHFVQLLTQMRKHRYFPEYYASLAISGKDGTLEERLSKSETLARVRAKTGTLDHVSALSGYIHTKSDRLIAFSILFNETPRKGWRYRDLQDDILEKVIKQF